MLGHTHELEIGLVRSNYDLPIGVAVVALQLFVLESDLTEGRRDLGLRNVVHSPQISKHSRSGDVEECSDWLVVHLPQFLGLEYVDRNIVSPNYLRLTDDSFLQNQVYFVEHSCVSEYELPSFVLNFFLSEGLVSLEHELEAAAAQHSKTLASSVRNFEGQLLDNLAMCSDLSD